MVTAVLVAVSAAYGAAVKIKTFDVFAPEDTVNADGMAILNYVAGNDKTIVQLIVSDFTPDTVYGVLLTDGLLNLEIPDAFMADENGHGNFHEEIPSLDASGFDIELYVDDGVTCNLCVDGDRDGDGFVFEAGELRAIGENNS
jgi:hypothetical protein